MLAKIMEKDVFKMELREYLPHWGRGKYLSRIRNHIKKEGLPKANTMEFYFAVKNSKDAKEYHEKITENLVDGLFWILAWN